MNRLNYASLIVTDLMLSHRSVVLSAQVPVQFSDSQKLSSPSVPFKEISAFNVRSNLAQATNR
jgi:hypothetical protein